MEEREAQGDMTVLQGDAGLLKTCVQLGEFVYGGSQYCGAYEWGLHPELVTCPNLKLLAWVCTVKNSVASLLHDIDVVLPATRLGAAQTSSPVGTRRPSGRGAAAGEEGLLIEAVSAAGHRSLGGNGGGCDIDIAGEAMQGY
jgi:hypothetical protein